MTLLWKTLSLPPLFQGPQNLLLPLPSDPEIPLEALDDRVVHVVAVLVLDVPHKVHLHLGDVSTDLALWKIN